MMVFEERGKPSSRRKSSRSGVENQQTQPTYEAGSGNRTRDTLVEGERSPHCANPAPQGVLQQEDPAKKKIIKQFLSRFHPSRHFIKPSRGSFLFLLVAKRFRSIDRLESKPSIQHDFVWTGHFSLGC